MTSPESRGVIILDTDEIILIAIWCFVGAAFLFMCCALCCCGGTSKDESPDSGPEVPLDDLESAWPRYPESVLRADSVQTLPRYSPVDDPPKYTRSVEFEHC